MSTINGAGLSVGAPEPTIDSTPTVGSSNAVSSGGVYTALTSKTDNTDFASHTSNSTVHVTSSEKSTWNSKVDASVLNSYVPKTRTVNNKALSSNISLSASDVGAVPTSRTVNGKALSSNISLNASDVGAVSSLPVSIKFSSIFNKTYSLSVTTTENTIEDPVTNVSADVLKKAIFFVIRTTPTSNFKNNDSVNVEFRENRKESTISRTAFNNSDSTDRQLGPLCSIATAIYSGDYAYQNNVETLNKGVLDARNTGYDTVEFGQNTYPYICVKYRNYSTTSTTHTINLSVNVYAAYID